MVGLAGEQVAPARAAVDEQPLPGGMASLDLGAVRRARACAQRRRLLLDPAERRDVVVRAEEDPRLRTRRSARRGRSPIRRAGDVPSASQRAIVGALPSRIARCSTGSASPSISRNTIPGASVRTRSPERRAIRWMTRNVKVSSSFVPKSASSATRDPGRDERNQERRAERVDREVAVRDAVGGEQHERVEHEYEHESDEKCQRQTERCDERRQDRVQDADHGGCEQGDPEGRDVSARDDPGGREQ